MAPPTQAIAPSTELLLPTDDTTLPRKVPYPLNKDAANLLSALVGTEHPDGEFHNPASVYARIESFISGSDDHLDPSPVINSALGDLVDHLQGHTVPTACKASFAAVEQSVCNFIDDNFALKMYADNIRSVACRAESRLELFYVKALLRQKNIYEEFSPHLSYVDRIIQAASEFPYTNNYVVMTDKEAEVLQRLLQSRDPGEIHLIFCGSGPLPLTGLLFAAYLNCKVTLVDCDAEAVHISKRLIQMWEERRVLPPGRINVLHANGTDLRFRRRGQPMVQDEKQTTIECDVLFIAALIPNVVKEKMVKAASTLGSNAPLVALRSAHGLTARFAYYTTRRSVLTKYMPLLATVVPDTHIFENGHAVDDDRRPDASFPTEILNSIEVYGRRHC